MPMKHTMMENFLRKGERPFKNSPFIIGQQVRAKRTLAYCMGQCFDDRIPSRSVVTIDNFDDKGWLFFKEHADRYGPWDPDEFTAVRVFKKKKKAKR